MRVAVIGAGISGLFAIQSCLEEGLEPRCFEKSDQLGGIWVYRETAPNDGAARTYQGLRMNTSIYNDEASNFPYYTTATNFPTREEELEYLRRYADHFGLEDYIEYNTEVVEAVPDEEHWVVKRRCNNEEHVERFDAVLVCCGRFHKALVPNVSGIDKFKGRFMTANQFKGPKQDGIMDKRVLVIGNSFTAADISAIIADTTTQVYLSIGKGCSWLSTSWEEVPIDTFELNRGVVYSPYADELLVEVKKRYRDSDFPEQEQYGVSLHGEDHMKRPTLFTRQDLPSKIRQQKVKVKSHLVRLTDSEAVFADGTRIEVDTVLAATGYEISYPFLSKDIVADAANDLQLYKFMWPLTTDSPNLAFIGCAKIYQPQTAFLELQTRWAVMVIQGKCSLPNKAEMENEINYRHAALIEKFGKSETRTESTLLIHQDFMARQIGAMPKWWHYIFSNPLLAYIIRYGPAFACTYRLVGPHSQYSKASERAVELYNSWRTLEGNKWKYGQLFVMGALATGFLSAVIAKKTKI